LALTQMVRVMEMRRRVPVPHEGLKGLRRSGWLETPDSTQYAWNLAVL